MATAKVKIDFPFLESVATVQHEWVDDVMVHEIFTEDRDSSRLEDIARVLNKGGNAVLIACSFAAAQESNYQGAMDLPGRPLSAAEQSIYEPTRQVRCLAPPKRFFRKFWMSISRRLLEHHC